MRFAFLALLVLRPAQGADLFENFSAGWREQWEEKRLFTKATVYAVESEAGHPVLHATSQAAHAGLLRRVDYRNPLKAQLKWRWKVRNALGQAESERSRQGDDYAARVFVVFEESLLPLRTRALNYVWASREPLGASYPSPYTKNVGMYVVRSGAVDAGKWVEEERDLIADYQRYFGGSPRRISAVAVLVDTDNTGLEVEAWFGALNLMAESAPGR